MVQEVAPSDELRRWFGHDPERWEEFRRRYFEELEDRREVIQRLREWADGHALTLVYGASDQQQNNALALQQHLQREA